MNYSLMFLALLAVQSAVAQGKLGDNLGNHRANKTIDLNNNSIANLSGLSIGGSTLANANVAVQINGNKALIISHVTNLLDESNPAIPVSNRLNGMLVYDDATQQLYAYQNNQWVAFVATTLSNNQIFVGDASGKAKAVTLAGDITSTNAGAITIADNAVTTAKISNSTLIANDFADIALTTQKIAPSLSPGQLLTTTPTEVRWLYKSSYIYYIGDYKASSQISDHDNWLICDGRPLSRSAYSALFSVIGTSFGGGDGTTTFNIPDLRGRTPAAINGVIHSLGEKIGTEQHVLSIDEMPRHSHGGSTSSNGVHTHPSNIGEDVLRSGQGTNGAWSDPRNGAQDYTTAGGAHTHTFPISPSGNSNPINLMQPTSFFGNYFIYSANN